jgi:hypothetical protein
MKREITYQGIRTSRHGPRADGVLWKLAWPQITVLNRVCHHLIVQCLINALTVQVVSSFRLRD